MSAYIFNAAAADDEEEAASFDKKFDKYGLFKQQDAIAV